MASHNDLVLIINQLLKSMDKMGESLSVVKLIGEDVKAIAEDVKLIKNRLEKIEDRVSSSDKLPTKSDVLSIKQTLEGKLQPLEKVNGMDKRLCKIEDRISKLSSSDKLPTKSEVLSIKQTLDSKLKPLEKVNGMDKKLSKMEERISNLSLPKRQPDGMTFSPEIASESNNLVAGNPPIQFDSTIKGRNVHLTKNATCAERIRPHENDGLCGGVISSVPLREGKLFNIRIEETIDEWSNWGIAIGVLCNKGNAEVQEAMSIHYTIKETWAIRSWPSSTLGRSHTSKDTNRLTTNGYPLDTRLLKVGTVLGIKLSRNGDLRFFLNGEDKGIAFQNIPKNVYAFVDVIFYVTKISIVQ